MKLTPNLGPNEGELTLELLDDVDRPDKDPDAVVALGLVRRVLAEQERVVAGEVSVMLHADASPLHSKLEKNRNLSALSSHS